MNANNKTLSIVNPNVLKILRGPLKEFYKKIALFLTVVGNLGLLFYFKYFNFAVETFNKLFDKNVQFAKVILPIGISFFTFQGLSYVVDVYRKDVPAQKNIFKLGMYISLFPQLVAGPIERSKNLLKQINEEHRFSYERMCDGLMLMVWGYFMKLVIADRIAIFVDNAYSTKVLYDGRYLLLASVLFAFQIYCDFAGYSTIAIGAAKVLGFDLMENFDCPYFSETVAEFWRRWHISLSSWFRDYLYIPLGGNRKGKFRKYLNTMIVFLVSGLWHGANWTYVIWGGLNGIYQVIGSALQPVKQWEMRRKIWKIPKILVTFVLVDFTWIFFRADSLQQAGSVIDRIFHMNDPKLLANGMLFDLGLNKQNFVVIGVALCILLLADLVKYNGVKMREVILNRNIVVRWGMILVAVAVILTFGIWGSGYEATNFIYFQF